MLGLKPETCLLNLKRRVYIYSLEFLWIKLILTMKDTNSTECSSFYNLLGDKSLYS